MSDRRIYPGASCILTPEAMHTGKFAGGFPKGVTVHYTADPDVMRVHAALDERELGYHLVIDRAGKVYQFAYLDGTVAHAGKAMWCGLSPNRAHAAIALASWGKLEHDDSGLHAWNGHRIDSTMAAKRPGQDGKPAWWDPATPAQEAALAVILRWFLKEGIEGVHMCGHDECAIPAGRKVDPGGVLKTTMAELRKALAP